MKKKISQTKGGPSGLDELSCTVSYPCAAPRSTRLCRVCPNICSRSLLHDRTPCRPCSARLLADGDPDRGGERPSGPYTSLEDMNRLAAAGGGVVRVKAVVSDTKNCKLRKKKYLVSAQSILFCCSCLVVDGMVAVCASCCAECVKAFACQFAWLRRAVYAEHGFGSCSPL